MEESTNTTDQSRQSIANTIKSSFYYSLINQSRQNLAKTIRSPLYRILLITILSRIIILLLITVTSSFHAYNTYPSIYTNTSLELSVLRWDSIHFLFISQTGYKYETQLAFFPLYPCMINIINHMGRYISIFNDNSILVCFLAIKVITCVLKCLDRIYTIGRSNKMCQSNKSNKIRQSNKVDTPTPYEPRKTRTKQIVGSETTLIFLFILFNITMIKIISNPIYIGICISNISFIISNILLYKLTKQISKSIEFSYNTCILYCIYPGSVFNSTLYTESIFSMFSFYGMLSYRNPSLIAWIICSLTRSNGHILSIQIST
eukprot:GHVP01061056.1.p1 GENE.GHVP01061056.1~~GHVP01061056.1.p1  ORF type:complete len:318 (-),score=-7.47 GHVP01061056.1:435-1388(-)